MIFRQMFDGTSGTYSYLLASRRGGEALIIDPDLEKVDRYLQLLRELDLKLVKAVDTHLHADHITGLGTRRVWLLAAWGAGGGAGGGARRWLCRRRSVVGSSRCPGPIRNGFTPEFRCL